jgi:hypothetical protein
MYRFWSPFSTRQALTTAVRVATVVHAIATAARPNDVELAGCCASPLAANGSRNIDTHEHYIAPAQVMQTLYQLARGPEIVDL